MQDRKHYFMLACEMASSMAFRQADVLDGWQDGKQTSGHDFMQATMNARPQSNHRASVLSY